MLSYQDSNLDRQNQKLQCYHYTIRQSLSSSSLPVRKTRRSVSAKLIFFPDFSKYFYSGSLQGAFPDYAGAILGLSGRYFFIVK